MKKNYAKVWIFPFKIKALKISPSNCQFYDVIFPFPTYLASLFRALLALVGDKVFKRYSLRSNEALFEVGVDVTSRLRGWRTDIRWHYDIQGRTVEKVNGQIRWHYRYDGEHHQTEVISQLRDPNRPRTQVSFRYPHTL